MLVRASVFVAIALVAGPALAKDKPPGPMATGNEVACDGVFGPLSSEALLIEAFGADNVVTGQVPGPEGTEMLATTLFPDDPEKAMQIGWWDEAKRERLAYVDLSPSQVGPLGVRIGMSVAEVEALNGEPFTIGGFWWDYGGYAMIDTGELTDLPGGCYLSLRFAPVDEYSSALDVTPVSGEVVIPSDEGLLEILDVRAQVVSLSYPSPEGL